MVRRVLALASTAVVVFAGVALAADAGQYGGTTSQRSGRVPLRISLVVGHGAVSNIQLQAYVKVGGGACSVNVSATSFAFTKSKLSISRQGKFGGKLKDAAGDSVTISGRVKASKVSGSFSAKSTGGAAGSQVCSSGTVKYSAQLAGGQAKGTTYTGTSGPGYPLHFRISANGKAVDDLVVSFEETCTPGAGNTAPQFDFGTLAIRAGRFSGTAVDHSGSTVTNTLRINGSFFGRTAAGTVSDRAVITSLQPCTETSSFTATAR
jgi:hypothetical protein